MRERALSGQYSIGAKGKDNPMYGKNGELNPTFKGTILATEILSGTTIELKGTGEIEDAGFSPSKVYLCVNGKRKSHKGFTFKREQ